MKLLKTALCAAAATFAMAGAAQAQDVAFNVGVATDYVFRGIDQTFDADGQIFGGVDVTQDQFYGGIWLSNTGPKNAEALEYDIYAGWKPAVGGVNLDLGLIYYAYTDSDVAGGPSSDWNTLEIKAAASMPVGPATIGGAIYYAPENPGFSGGEESTLYLEANAAWTYKDGGPTVSAAVGTFSFDDDAVKLATGVDSYLTWNVGVTFPFNDKVGLDVRYHDTDSDATSIYGVTSGDAFVASLKYSF